MRLNVFSQHQHAPTRWLRIVLLLWSLIISACTQLAPITVPQSARVLLVNSDQQVERYRQAETAFLATLAEPVMQVNLAAHNLPQGYLQDLLNQHRFAAIYCIGAQGLSLIDTLNPNSPVVYSSVLNWHAFTNRPRFYGIGNAVPAASQLALFRHLFPDIHTIGLFYSAENQAWVDVARDAAAAAGLQLRAEQVRHSRWLDRQPALLADVDALWIISDQATLASRETAQRLFHHAQASGTPVFAYHPFFLEMGSVLTISADLPTTGRQAAVLISRLLRGGSPARAVQPPAGSHIQLDLTRAEHLGLRINEAALDQVDKILTE